MVITSQNKVMYDSSDISGVFSDGQLGLIYAQKRFESETVTLGHYTEIRTLEVYLELSDHIMSNDDYIMPDE